MQVQFTGQFMGARASKGGHVWAEFRTMDGGVLKLHAVAEGGYSFAALPIMEKGTFSGVLSPEMWGNGPVLTVKELAYRPTK